MTMATKSPSNAMGDPSQSLQTFSLHDLQQYTLEKSYALTASRDFHLFGFVAQSRLISNAVRPPWGRPGVYGSLGRHAGGRG